MTKKQTFKNYCGIRVKKETKQKLEKLLQNANKKQLGRKIKVDELIQLALELVDKPHIEKLQNQSLSNEDRKEKLRQIYVKKVGLISRDEFTGFMMSSDFSRFLEDHKMELAVA